MRKARQGTVPKLKQAMPVRVPRLLPLSSGPASYAAIKVDVSCAAEGRGIKTELDTPIN